MTEPISRRPNRVPWPPIIYFLVVLVALILHRLWPQQLPLFLVPHWLLIVGIAAAAVGMLLDVAAMVALRRARTTILPHRGSDRLVINGVFGLSRNPIYLGNTLALIGFGFVFGSIWLLAGALLAGVLVDRLAIRREELHLTARFGAEFAKYVQHVPRWLGPRR